MKNLGHGDFTSVLIESDWNLKTLLQPLSHATLTVLIESDWNLKLNDRSSKNRRHDVLIESDWNLKFVATCFAASE